MSSHHAPRVCFSLFFADDVARAITYTFAYDSKDKAVSPDVAPYIYRFTFPDDDNYFNAKDAGPDGHFFNANIRNTYPFTKL